VKFTISNDQAVIITPAGPRTVSTSHPFYFEICRALQHGVDDAVLAFIDAKTKLTEGMAAPFAKLGINNVTATVTDSIDPITVNPDMVVATTEDGLKITGRVAQMITDFKKKGIPFKALQNFWAKLQKNPLLVGKEGLLEFLTNNDVPLLPNGNFLAYKGVYKTDDPNVFEAYHDRSFKYTLGKVADLPREQCTVDVNNSCGPGLHVGGFSHASGYGDTMIDCEVDPSDVTSVPTGERYKLRACRVLPIRVNKDRTHYTTEYIDLAKQEVVKPELKEPLIDLDEPSGAMAYTPAEESVCADTKKGGGRNKKTTWYKLAGNRVLTQRKVKKPGDDWSDVRPTAQVPGKAISKPVQKVSIKGAAEMRTWYKKLSNGTIDRKRATSKPAGYSSHRPKG